MLSLLLSRRSVLLGGTDSN